MNNIKMLRDERGESQYDLADACDVPQSSIQQYETNGRGSNILDTFARMADHFNVSIDFLAGRTQIRDALTDEDQQLAYVIQRLRAPQMRDAALTILSELDRLLNAESKNNTGK